MINGCNTVHLFERCFWHVGATHAFVHARSQVFRSCLLGLNRDVWGSKEPASGIGTVAYASFSQIPEFYWCSFQVSLFLCGRLLKISSLLVCWVFGFCFCFSKCLYVCWLAGFWVPQICHVARQGLPCWHPLVPNWHLGSSSGVGFYFLWLDYWTSSLKLFQQCAQNMLWFFILLAW